jgi:hypothetical protein
MTDAEKMMRLYAAELDTERRFRQTMDGGDVQAARVAAHEYTQAYVACTQCALAGVEPYNDFT